MKSFVRNLHFAELHGYDKIGVVYLVNTDSGVGGGSISFESDGYGSGISGEAVALQALQNMYNSATSALSSNIRKNKAKIKYNTIVYLINSDEVR